jgi:hypothetical protein
VIFAAGRVTLKQHRFEVVLAGAAAVLAGLVGVSIAVRIGILNVPPACLDAVVASPNGSGVAPDCLALVREGAAILGETFLTGEGTLAISIMGVVPILAGLLGGVPIVARELEARTASTAWSLNGSRSRWLNRQIWPIGLVVGATVVFAATAAIPVADASVAWGRSASSLIGLHGAHAVLRAFSAFGVGLAVGALVGRTLPAFILAVLLTVGLALGSGFAKDLWTRSLPAITVQHAAADSGEPATGPRTIVTGWGVVAPDGTLLSVASARELASADGVPPAAEFDTQDTPALEWYAANGYTLVPVGVTDEAALGWSLYDGVLFGSVGLIGILAAHAAAARARPR